MVNFFHYFCEEAKKRGFDFNKSKSSTSVYFSILDKNQEEKTVRLSDHDVDSEGMITVFNFETQEEEKIIRNSVDFSFNLKNHFKKYIYDENEIRGWADDHELSDDSDLFDNFCANIKNFENDFIQFLINEEEIENKNEYSDFIFDCSEYKIKNLQQSFIENNYADECYQIERQMAEGEYMDNFWHSSDSDNILKEEEAEELVAYILNEYLNI